ncbi:type IV pilin protein [Thalassolituus sp. LLYu03]|uniref:type IV pilin protein n=1 Tax=Thalassolituus sp. LLYu03 TaxID=3421656 RepID=UPI003D29E6D2
MKQTGFTLIELVVTMAIIAILVSVGLPSYKSYTMRGNRTDGIEALQQLLDAQERYYGDNMEYADDLKKLGLSSSTYTTQRNFYTIKVEKCTGMDYYQCVQLRATPSSVQSEDGQLLFNSAGKQVRIVGGSEIDL